MKNKGKSKFSIRLKTLRLKNNLTYVELSKLLLVNKSTVYDWENRGKEPSYFTLIKLVKLFNTSIDYILGITDKK